MRKASSLGTSSLVLQGGSVICTSWQSPGNLLEEHKVVSTKWGGGEDLGPETQQTDLAKAGLLALKENEI